MTKTFGFLLLLSVLSSCASWTVSIESVDQPEPKSWVVGGGIGVSPGTAKARQNFPAANEGSHVGTLFLNGRYGIAQDWELAAEGAFAFIEKGLGLRARKRWWNEGGMAAVASLGPFVSAHEVHDAAPYNGVTSEKERVTGIMASQSFGLLWANGWQVYGGPKLAWANWTGEYGLSTGGETRRQWNGLMPGAFVGVAHQWVTGGNWDLQLDLLFTIMSLPRHLGGGSAALWPGGRLAVQFSPGSGGSSH